MTVNSKTSDSDRERQASDIDQLFDDLAALAELTHDRESFYDSLLKRTATFSNSPHAILWMNGPGNDLLVSKTFGNELTAVAAAASKRGISEASDVIRSILVEPEGRKLQAFIAAPIMLLEERVGILAFYRPPNESIEIAQAYLPFMDAISEIASEFERNQKLLEQVRDGEKFEAISRLSLNANRSLDSKHSAFHLVNDTREYIGCDRVGLFVGSVGQARLLACSGVANTNNRSAYAKTLRPVIKKLMKTREPIVVQQNSDPQSREVRKYLSTFPTNQQPKQIAIVPLTPPQANKSRRSRPIGAIVFESFESQDTASFFQAINEVTEHACSAMANALKYERIPLRWFWNSLTVASNQFSVQHFMRTTLFSLLFAATVYFLIVSQMEFKVEVHGELRPVQERNVFAPADGIVSEILVQHGDTVKANQIIMTLRSPELELELKQLESDIKTSERKLDGLLTIMKTSDSSDPDNAMVQSRLAAEVIETQSVISGLASRRELVNRRVEEMVVESPIAGDVITWQVTQLLAGRPVRRGESLLKIADVTGEWEVALNVPDKKFGYVANAQKAEHRDDLVISLALASNPSKQYETRLNSISMASVARENQETTVRVTASMNANDTGEFKPGTSVVGRVHCGQHNIVYVWTVELFDALRRNYFW